MAVLKFDAEGVRKLVDHAAAASEHRAAYGQDPRPGLMLVGDQGVYLMSTGLPVLPHPTKKVIGTGEPCNFVVYADGINPDLDPFDAWWSRKGATYGGDDGCDVIPLPGFQQALKAPFKGKIEVEITPTTLGVMVPVRQRSPRPTAPCPRCGATGGERCRTRAGKPTSAHKGRRR